MSDDVIKELLRLFWKTCQDLFLTVPGLHSPKSDGAFFIFLGLIGLLVFAYIIGKRVAHFLRRSQVRFYRVYRHQ
jgi:hypothetical protein